MAASSSSVSSTARVRAGAVRHQFTVALGKGGAVLAHIDHQAVLHDMLGNGLQTADELRAEHQHVHLRQVAAVLDLIGGVAEVQRHGQGAGLQDAEVDGQPFQAVHQQDGHLVALPDSAADEHVGKPVGLFVKHAPGDLPAIGRSLRGLDQGVFLPGHSPVVLLFRVQLHQGHFVPVQLPVALQVFCNRHVNAPPRLFFLWFPSFLSGMSTYNHVGTPERRGYACPA